MPSQLKVIFSITGTPFLSVKNETAELCWRIQNAINVGVAGGRGALIQQFLPVVQNVKHVNQKSFAMLPACHAAFDFGPNSLAAGVAYWAAFERHLWSVERAWQPRLSPGNLAGFPASGIRLVQHPFPGPLQATLTPHPKCLTDAAEDFGQYFWVIFPQTRLISGRQGVREGFWDRCSLDLCPTTCTQFKFAYICQEERAPCLYELA